MAAGSLKPGLVLCATPIGNLEDISLRAIRTLSEVDIVACEDTRRTRKLMAAHSISGPRLVSFHEGNERAQTRYLVERMTSGARVALVTDAGTPGVSDPGYRLVQACLTAGVEVGAIPGPSAAIMAVTLSGLPAARFAFEGFLPRRETERRRRIRELAGETRTIVLYESPRRLAGLLSDLSELLGDRRAAVARELTKVHEEVRRDRLAKLARWAAEEEPRGEIVVVVEGGRDERRSRVPPERLAAAARGLMEAGMSRREAMAEVAQAYEVRRREVFDALVEVPEPGPG